VALRALKPPLLGATDQETADALGIDQGTLDRWKTRHKEFRIAIQHGKIRADDELIDLNDLTGGFIGDIIDSIY